MLGLAEVAIASAQMPPQSGAPVVRPVESGQIIARIGPEVVLASEILPRVNELLEHNKAQIPPEELDAARQMVMRHELAQLIETKLLYVDARRKLPKENMPQVEEKVGLQFDETQLPKLYKSTGTSSRSELDAKLVQLGTSLMQQKRFYLERMLASQWLRQQVTLDREITHDELLADYREHQREYEFEAKARWEEIMVRFDRFRTQEEAYASLAAWGNDVFRGVPFAEVARAHSHSPSAQRGGQYDWTTQGSLVSAELNRALFTLPVGQLSQILKSSTGFHIVRVVERRGAGCTPFVDAQVEIRKRLQKEANQREINTYLTRLREQTAVWTIFDTAEAPLAAQLGKRSESRSDATQR